MIKLAIVDDQSTIREFLKIHLDSIPDISVVGAASNGKEAIDTIEKCQPDIVLMDIEMPIMNGIEATKIISETFTNVMVVLFTTRDDKQQLNLALRAGARGYVLKTTSPKDLVEIIHLTVKGFFNLGPIIGNWNEETTSSAIETEEPKISLSRSNASVLLSDLTDRILELRRAVESQETKIVNLTNKIAYGQNEFSSRSDRRKLLNGRYSGRTSVKYYLDKKRQNTLFISGFLLGAFMVVTILVLFVAIKTFVL
ncbi:response regulator transcription factor [Myxosarcina sp. GI1]|uniref:response regulator n=1 Tax=Myxosarcina sp. GI1 TaxID=1541065 RepID=UPI00068DB31B|nr:response regulator transcription factor [Myxosarcina sp. GI1]